MHKKIPLGMLVDGWLGQQHVKLRNVLIQYQIQVQLHALHISLIAVSTGQDASILLLAIHMFFQLKLNAMQPQMEGEIFVDMMVDLLVVLKHVMIELQILALLYARLIFQIVLLTGNLVLLQVLAILTHTSLLQIAV